MNNLELVTLKRYCDKYGLDYQEIDDSLTYWENKKHLQSLVRMLSRSLDTFELARYKAMQEQYMKEHALSYYIMCQLADETKSAETGPPDEPVNFSLEAYIEANQ